MRGTILREPSGSAAGLVSVNGAQYQFVLDKIWHSPSLPVIGSAVDVDLNKSGSVCAITAVSESQLMQEQAEAALRLARDKGTAFARGLLAQFGLYNLAALGVIALSWFFLTAISYNAGFLGRIDFTFWRILALVNAGGPMEGLRSLSGDAGSPGIYGLLACAALLAPLAGYLWKNKLAELGGVVPLAFMIFAGLAVRHALSRATSGFENVIDVDAIRAELMKNISLGTGAYLAIAASLFLACKSALRYLSISSQP